jgi:hypothetical protein
LSSGYSAVEGVTDWADPVEGFTRTELFPNFLVTHLDPIPGCSGRYCLRMLHHLVSGSKAQCLPLSLVWFTKDVDNIQLPSHKLRYGYCTVPICQHPLLIHFFANGYGAQGDGCFRNKLLEGFYLCERHNTEWLLPNQVIPNLRLVTGANEIDHVLL